MEVIARGVDEAETVLWVLDGGLTVRVPKHQDVLFSCEEFWALAKATPEQEAAYYRRKFGEVDDGVARD